MRQTLSATAAKMREAMKPIFNALKQSSRIITKANPPPTMNQNNSPSKPHVRQQMLVVAIDWELYQRTHSALALAFVGLSLMIPMILCTIPAGHLADVFNRKKIVLV